MKSRHSSIARRLHGGWTTSQQAFDVLLRGVPAAFDLTKEDSRTVASYDTSHLFRMEDYHKGGKHYGNQVNQSRVSNLLGKQMLLARRLCEAGCGFVTVVDSCWDFHGDGNNPPTPVGMSFLGPQLDHAIVAFLEDVHQRRPERHQILLIVTGEMGRSPVKNSKNGGTDHNASLTPLLLAGGGLKMGQVIGESNRSGSAPATRATAPKTCWPRCCTPFSTWANCVPRPGNPPGEHQQPGTG